MCNSVWAALQIFKYQYYHALLSTRISLVYNRCMGNVPGGHIHEQAILKECYTTGKLQKAAWASVTATAERM